LIDSFADFKEQKNIDRVTMMHILEDVIRGMIVQAWIGSPALPRFLTS